MTGTARPSGAGDQATADRLTGQRPQLQSEFLRGLLAPAPVGVDRDPDPYMWTVSLYDELLDRLMPIFPETVTDADDPRAWPPGRGAVGTAFKAEAIMVVTGAAVSDLTHGLSAAQQTMYRGYATVVACPVLVNGTAVGVPSAVKRGEDYMFSQPEGQQTLLTLAQTVGERLSHDLIPEVVIRCL